MEFMKSKLMLIVLAVLLLIFSLINYVDCDFFGLGGFSKHNSNQAFLCPNPDVTFNLYTITRSNIWRRTQIDLRNKRSLYNCGWNPNKQNVIVIHGFNGAETDRLMVILRNAYLTRGDFNVFMVDWSPLTQYPFYPTSLKNTRLVSQCTAQLYSFLTHSGASAYRTHCVGHSLGAHICGMMSNYLTQRQHKIIGLDPAKPLIDMFKNDEFRLTRDDANFVEVIHTNSGAYGEYPQIGHVDFSINGGHVQPVCTNQPNIIQRFRCSHFKSVCYFASSLSKRRNMFWGIHCTENCNTLIPSKTSNGIDLIPMGLQTPEWARGTFYVPYDDPDNFCRFSN